MTTGAILTIIIGWALFAVVLGVFIAKTGKSKSKWED
jgi:hypothetical protein